MEYLIDFILELVIEGSIEASKNKKVPKPLRYVALIIVLLFFICVISLIIFVGILVLKQSIIGGILLILLGIFMVIASVLKFRKMYLLKVNDK